MTRTWVRYVWMGVAAVCVAGVLLGLVWNQHQDTLYNALLL